MTSAEVTFAGACPRCGAPRGPRQEYCLECGLRLPGTDGALARLRDGWVRWIGWYPGDWVWPALLALAVAAAAAAAAIAATRSADSSPGTTLVYTSASVGVTMPPTSAAAAPARPSQTLPTAPEPTQPATASPPNGETVWPAGASGWTVVLVSLPSTADGRTQANAQAKHAVGGGLPEVGVLLSSHYSSLHPGYLIVFSGVYDSRDQADSTLPAAHAAGFAGAYVRQIAQ